MSTTIEYGNDPNQIGDLTVPAAATAHSPAAVVVLFHGGFWQEQYRRDLMTPLATDLAARGYATWNIEYRRVGASGGGWPATFDDVSAAVDYLAVLARTYAIDLDRVALVGHSAGGHLVLWLAARGGLPAGTPGADPKVVPTYVVAQAPVADLRRAFRDGVGGDAVADLIGGDPTTVPDRYDLGSPIERLPVRVPFALVHGRDDDIVPASQSETLAAAATHAGDEVELVLLDGVDHFAVIDPTTSAWAEIVRLLEGHRS